MPEMNKRTIANGLKTTIMGLGGTGLGNMYRAVDTDVAIATVRADTIALVISSNSTTGSTAVLALSGTGKAANPQLTVSAASLSQA